MYCGSNKTALQSQRQIANAMMALLAEKPFARITVSELCKGAGISRQTFYTLFTSRENVMVFTLQARCCHAPELAPRPAGKDGDPRRERLRGLCRGYSDYLLRNQGLIKLLVDNHIDYLLYDTFFEALDGCDCFLESVEPCTRRYAASFYAGGISSVARRFAQEDCAATADQLEQLLMTMFTGELF